MISRRQLRIKTLQVQYAFYKQQDHSVQQGEKELFHSIDRMYLLYFHLFGLLDDVMRIAEDKAEMGRNKQQPTYLDLNPITRFIDNRVAKQIFNSDTFLQFRNKSKLSWVQTPELASKLYKQLKESDAYIYYLNEAEDSYKNDNDILCFFFSDLLYNSPDLYEILEEQSIFWNDDIDFTLINAEKTVASIKEKDGDDVKFFPAFKQAVDKDFVSELFRKSILHHAKHRDFIDQVLENWDIERVSYTETLILTLAITELETFPSIPVRVTLNEYIELGRRYGSERSSKFINGILDKMIDILKEEGRLIKTGRGLIDVKKNG